MAGLPVLPGAAWRAPSTDPAPSHDPFGAVLTYPLCPHLSSELSPMPLPLLAIPRKAPHPAAEASTKPAQRKALQPTQSYISQPTQRDAPLHAARALPQPPQTEQTASRVSETAAHPHLLSALSAFSSLTYPSGASSFSDLLVATIAPTSLQQYQRALEQFRRWLSSSFVEPELTPPSMAYHALLERYLLNIAATSSPSTVRGFLAAATFLHTVRLWPESPSPQHWTSLKALPRLLPSPSRPRGWFSPDLFCAAALTSCAPLTRIAFLLAFVYLLRISEVTRLTLRSFSDLYVCLAPSKSAHTNLWRPIAPALRFLLNHIRVNALTPTTPLFTAALLSSAIGSLPCSPRLTFHSLRRGGAATLVALGVSPEALKYWGRWSSDATASLYFEQQFPTALPASIQLPSSSSTSTLYTVPLAQLWPQHLLTHFHLLASASPTHPPGPSESPSDAPASESVPRPAGKPASRTALRRRPPAPRRRTRPPTAAVPQPRRRARPIRQPAGEPPPRAHPENTTPVVGRMRKRTASVASLDLPEPSPRAARPSSRRRVAEP